MRRLPWHVAVRADRRAVLTALGIALGVAFAVVSFAVPGALSTESVSPDGPLAHADTLVSFADGSPLRDDITTRPDVLLVATANVRVEPLGNATLATFRGPRAFSLGPDEARPGIALEMPATVTLGDRTLHAGAALTDAHVGREWIVVAPETFEGVAPPTSIVHYAVIPAVDARTLRSLQDHGYVVGSLPGIDPFFQVSAGEVARDLVFVVAFSSILVALFIYEFLRSEIREKRREIGLWRAIGLRSRHTAILLLARAEAMVLLGCALGIAVGTLAILGAGTSTGSALFSATPSWPLLAGATASALVAGLAGGLIPALAAARTPIREQLEAEP